MSEPSYADHTFEISARFELCTPLHIGSGRFREIASVRGALNEKKNRTPGVAAIQRDAKGHPYVPGSTWKGFLLDQARKCYRDRMGDVVTPLFGAISDHDNETGNIGALRFSGSAIADLQENTAVMPFVGDLSTGTATDVAPSEEATSLNALIDARSLGKGVFVSGRTRIDPSTGTAEDGKLFFQEMVAPGATLPLSLVLSGDSKEAVSLDRLAHVVGLLEGLNTPAALGKGSGAALGEVKLVPGSIKVIRHRLTPALDWVSEELKDVRGAEANACEAVASRAFQLTCPGPFIVVDSSRSDKRSKLERDLAQQENAQRQQIQPSRLKADFPLLMGPSLKGALRSRASWFQALGRHRAMLQEGKAPTPEVCDDPERILRPGEDPTGLSPVQRLFGVTGFKGLLRIHDFTVSKAEEMSMTSVKLDRFSGGPIDGALFSTLTFIGTQLGFTLSLESRGSTTPSTADIELFEALLADIEKNGLLLGHGTNKGFGWFEVEKREGAR